MVTRPYNSLATTAQEVLSCEPHGPSKRRPALERQPQRVDDRVEERRLRLLPRQALTAAWANTAPKRLTR